MSGVESTFNALQNVVEADTDCVVASLELMERTNLNAVNKYMNLSDAAKGLNADREYLLKTCKYFGL
jgi:hypothetical protein